MQKHSVTLQSAFQTREFAKNLAQKILAGAFGFRKAVVIGLKGELGAGKTTFAQGFAKGLGMKEKITSPTFVILKKFGNFYHIDAYRLQNPRELLALGWKEIIADPRNIVLVEWADRVKKILPKDAMRIVFSYGGKNIRSVTGNKNGMIQDNG